MRNSFAAAFALILISLGARDALSAERNLQCGTGPVERDFGGTQWNVFACDDGKSVVIVSAKANPASPFYFLVYYKDGGYGVSGEGNGDKASFAAAFEQIKLLSKQDFEDLFDAANAIGK